MKLILKKKRLNYEETSMLFALGQSGVAEMMMIGH